MFYNQKNIVQFMIRHGYHRPCRVDIRFTTIDISVFRYLPGVSNDTAIIRQSEYAGPAGGTLSAGTINGNACIYFLSQNEMDHS